ncbi:SHOCT domain-containing protein [Streptomyces laculatispora]|uniref:SHOCT domain-containing protein n=1 Tax=Streptomyces laculatispora TaxID=887464 RepID=UPI0027DD9432|nr:SHOCT domain-containing protein [Streptomyces laculatispora]
MNRRGPGLLGTVARTAVVAGTASAVSGRVQQRQQAKFSERDAEQAAEPQAQQQAAEPSPDDLIGQLERLGALKKQGVLTDAEFVAQKNRLLAE